MVIRSGFNTDYTYSELLINSCYVMLCYCRNNNYEFVSFVG